ncbi:MAG: histidine phosphatase family protein [Nitrospiraceae bacterium]|nr:histidine phosphatase family protein [Nitrospiraceae bacterium]
MDVEEEIGRGEIWLVRHGETEWSASGRHTGRTDLPLNAEGRRQAEGLRGRLGGKSFALVLSSPLLRAAETCRLAGFGDAAKCDEGLREWDYGDYEGLTTEQIRGRAPGWTLWTGDPPHGERIGDVAGRAQRVIGRARGVKGDTVLFSHGHFLRVLAACWLGLPPDDGRFFALGTASVGILGYEREAPVISLWNEACGAGREKS